MRTITIKGKGKAVRNPDLVICNISTSCLKEEFDDAVESMNKLVDDLKLSLKDNGFDAEDLKTVSYDIHQRYGHVKKGVINKHYQQKFLGFLVEHDLKLEFDLDNYKITKLVNCLKNFSEKLEFKLIFSVKDKDGMKKEVLLDATKNARFHAEILAEASSAKLGDLIKIDYGWVDVNFESNTDLRHFMKSSPTVDYSLMNITPEEIEISDNVTFVGELI